MCESVCVLNVRVRDEIGRERKWDPLAMVRLHNENKLGSVSSSLGEPCLG